MRILVVHNQYRELGGEDVVAAAESKMLAANGQAVQRLTVSNHEISGLSSIVKAAWHAPYAAAGRDRVAAAIAAFGPDVVHVHNFFLVLTPAIYDACRTAGVPVVQTLHNYRLMCPKATLFRRSAPCEICLNASPYNAVLYGCYRGSRLASLAPARLVAINRRRGTWAAKITRFVALSQFARGIFLRIGLPADRIDVKPNFTSASPKKEEEDGRTGALYVGQLIEEKGIATLAAAWRGLEVPLRVAGGGPMAGTLAGLSHVAALGALPAEAVTGEMARAAFLVLPSLWYEMFPMVLAEAFAAGLPAIVSRLGSLAEIVEDGVTGLHVTPNDPDDLATKVRWAHEHPEEMQRMGRAARAEYERKYTPEANYPQLMSIYEKALADFAERQESGSG